MSCYGEMNWKETLCFTYLLLKCGSCIVVLSGCNQELCLDDPAIEYQYMCTVNGSNILRWNVYRNSSVQDLLDTESYTSGDNPSSPVSFTNAPEFSTGYIANNPSLVSNISFTAQSSINGYFIVCEDGEDNSENCSINISGVLYPPMDIDIGDAQNLVTVISWSRPRNISDCFDHYTVQSNATSGPPITTTGTSANIPLEGLSAGVYCVSVAAVDRADRTGEYSEEECFELNVPNSPSFVEIEVNNVTGSCLAEIKLSWQFVSTRTSILPLTAVYFSYTSSDYNETNLKLHATDTSYSIEAKRGLNYTVTVFGENFVGNGSNTTIDLIISFCDASPSSTEVPTLSDKQDVTAIAVGITIPLVLVIALLVAIVIVIAVCILKPQLRKDTSNCLMFPKNYIQNHMSKDSYIPPQMDISKSTETIKNSSKDNSIPPEQGNNYS